MKQGKNASPAKTALEEARRLRKLHRETVRSFSARIEADLATVSAQLTAELSHENSPHLRELREMTTLMRQLEIKPAKGRRRDLRRIENVVEELRHLSKGW